MAFLAISLGCASYLYYLKIQSAQLNSIKDELNAISDLKVKEIASWYRERVIDAGQIQDMAAGHSRMASFLEDSQNPDAQQFLKGWMASLKRRCGYERVLLFNARGELRMAYPDGPDNMDAQARAALDEAIRTRSLQLAPPLRPTRRSPSPAAC